MKKVFKSFLILFVFCLSFILCGTYDFSTNYVDASAPTIIKLANATDASKGVVGFADYVNAYSSANANDDLVLTEDINLSAKTLTTTIGTVESPFAGSFDGKGYKVSNAVIDLSGESLSNQYLGLFGYIQGSSTTRTVVKNLSISGNFTMKAATPTSLFVGSFAGYAKHAFFKNVQLNANVFIDASNDFNAVYGGIVGQLVDSEINSVICRPSSVSSLTFDNSDAKFYSVGGIVGDQNNSQIFFAVANETIKVDIDPGFIGDLNVGGISGRVSQGKSKIINVAMQNSYEITGREENTNVQTTIKVGQVAGVIANPAPEFDITTALTSISYIHYSSSQEVSLFGDMGGYAFLDESTKDYITVANETFGTEAYFNNQKWHDIYGLWDFDSVWYIGANVINLQCFYGNFTVKLANNINSMVLENESVLQANYRYGDTVSLAFKFKDGMDTYFNLNGLQLDGVQIAGISENIDGSYRLTGIDERFYSITNNVDEKTFEITIKEVNLSTKGEYGIDTPAEKFTLTFKTKLFKKDESGVESVVQGEVPGYVYYAENTSSEVRRTQIVDKEIKYGRTEPYSFGTVGKENAPIAFEGWFIEKEGGDTRLTDSSAPILSFDFGVPFKNDGLKIIKESCTIYAKYVENACRLTFDMDEGVAKVELFAGEKIISDNTQFADVSKTATQLRLDVFILKDYEFNVEKFIDFLGTYRTDMTNEEFCTLIEDPFIEGNMTHYKFHINMSNLNTVNFSEGMNIRVQTEEIEKDDMGWIWIAVGAGGGALVLILLIVIIVVAKRRGGGGRSMKSGGSFKKKSVKGMYY